MLATEAAMPGFLPPAMAQAGPYTAQRKRLAEAMSSSTSDGSAVSTTRYHHGDGAPLGFVGQTRQRGTRDITGPGVANVIVRQWPKTKFHEEWSAGQLMFWFNGHKDRQNGVVSPAVLGGTPTTIVSVPQLMAILDSKNRKANLRPPRTVFSGDFVAPEGETTIGAIRRLIGAFRDLGTMVIELIQNTRMGVTPHFNFDTDVKTWASMDPATVHLQDLRGLSAPSMDQDADATLWWPHLPQLRRRLADLDRFMVSLGARLSRVTPRATASMLANEELTTATLLSYYIDQLEQQQPLGPSTSLPASSSASSALSLSARSSLGSSTSSSTSSSLSSSGSSSGSSSAISVLSASGAAKAPPVVLIGTDETEKDDVAFESIAEVTTKFLRLTGVLSSCDVRENGVCSAELFFTGNALCRNYWGEGLKHGAHVGFIFKRLVAGGPFVLEAWTSTKRREPKEKELRSALPYGAHELGKFIRVGMVVETDATTRTNEFPGGGRQWTSSSTAKSETKLSAVGIYEGSVDTLRAARDARGLRDAVVIHLCPSLI
jgi:hypothetical protein